MGIPNAPLPLKDIHMRGAQLYADRFDALEYFPQGGHIAEIGVASGDFSEEIISRLKPKRFDAIDLFNLHQQEVVMGTPSRELFGEKTHRQAYEERFAGQIEQGQLQILQGESHQILASRPDGEYHMIYIDAGHEYDFVKRDAELAIQKLKDGGFLVFNDYIMHDYMLGVDYGIVPVVNELCVNDGWFIHYFALHKFMFCDICIARHPAPTHGRKRRPKHYLSTSISKSTIPGKGKLRQALARLWSFFCSFGPRGNR